MKQKTGGIYLLYFLCAAILLATGCGNISFHRPEKVNGTVISVDEVKKEIVIKDSASGKQRTITVKSADKLNGLKPGMEIKAYIKRGTAVAEKITPKAVKGSDKAGKKKAVEE